MTEAVFLYDGDCAFCTACVRFLQRHTRSRATLVPWQLSDLDALGVTVEQCDTAVQWVAGGEPVESGPDAVARLLRGSTGYLGLWKLAGAILSVPPVSWLAWPVYRWVARNRHRMPGGTAACSLPRG